MHTHYPADKITIHHSDALKFDFAGLIKFDGLNKDAGANLRVVGNLPYNISTPILFHLLEQSRNIVDMHFMLQKEVVERMVAQPSTPEYADFP